MLFSLKFNTYQWISMKLLYGWTQLYDVVLYFHVFSICFHSSIEPGVSADKCLRKLPGYTYLAFQVCYKPILHPKKSPLRLILESFGLSWIQNKISLTHARCRQWFKRGHLQMTSATKTHSLKGRGIEQSCDYKTHHKVLRTRHSCHNCIPCHRIMWNTCNCDSNIMPIMSANVLYHGILVSHCMFTNHAWEILGAWERQEILPSQRRGCPRNLGAYHNMPTGHTQV